ncbi:hypothetical protein EBT25_05825 [bacterium]|nr:hypothetical protein [bacterium]
MTESEQKIFSEALKEAKNDWVKLADKLQEFTEKYVKSLTEINKKLEEYKPPRFYQTSTFWFSILWLLAVVIFCSYALSSGKCVKYDKLEVGNCQTV